MLAGVGWGCRDPDGDGPLIEGLCGRPFADAPHTTRHLRLREQMNVAVVPSARTFLTLAAAQRVSGVRAWPSLVQRAGGRRVTVSPARQRWRHPGWSARPHVARGLSLTPCVFLDTERCLQA